MYRGPSRVVETACHWVVFGAHDRCIDLGNPVLNTCTYIGRSLVGVWGVGGE